MCEAFYLIIPGPTSSAQLCVLVMFTAVVSMDLFDSPVKRVVTMVVAAML